MRVRICVRLPARISVCVCVHPGKCVNMCCMSVSVCVSHFQGGTFNSLMNDVMLWAVL